MEFEDDEYYPGPPLTEALVASAERSLGFRLPSSYLDLLRTRNGGVPKARCFPTPFPTSWADDHVELSGIRGLGGTGGIDSEGALGSRALVREWGYPDIGAVLCDLPSGGHDVIMLDYRGCGPQGEPAVAYVDEDRVPRQLAPDFAGFVQGLRPCSDAPAGRWAPDSWSGAAPGPAEEWETSH